MQAMKWMMAAGALAALAACGGGGDDAGDPPLPPGTIQVSGAKQDGTTENDDFDGRYALTGSAVTESCGIIGNSKVTLTDSADEMLVELCTRSSDSSIVFLVVKNNGTDEGYACAANNVDRPCPAGATLNLTDRTLTLQNVALKGETSFDENARITVNGTLTWDAAPTPP